MTFDTVQPYRAGLSLSANSNASVNVAAEVDDGSCVRGRGALEVSGVAGGRTVGPVVLQVTHTAGCQPIADAGMDTASGGGGNTGAGNGTGTGGTPTGAGGSPTGAGGVLGSGGAGSAGRSGAGGAGAGGTGSRAPAAPGLAASTRERRPD